LATLFHSPAPDNGALTEARERAERHAEEAERLLKSWWLSSHVKGLLHATLALYYSAPSADCETRDA
jgi:hypothetical protein